MKKTYWILKVMVLALLIFPVSMAFSQNSQGQGFGARPQGSAVGSLVVAIHECDCDDCDHEEEEEEENYQYYLKTSNGTLYTLHLGPKWWRAENLNQALFKEGERVEATGWLRDNAENTIMVTSLRFPHTTISIRGESGSPPWGQQKENRMDEDWIETGDFH